MTNETLSHVLRSVSLCNCQHVRDNIYYIKKKVEQRYYSCELRREKRFLEEYEFLIITEGSNKAAIILNCGNLDLHWYVFKHCRGRHILSNALRSGIIKEVWPLVKEITCCYDYWEDDEIKKKMTEHLAELAGLCVVE